jgi:hypothetical protein
VGALFTLELPGDSPVLSMPWIITFGPMSEDEEWEPVVCGPYERPHALALAEEIVADEELIAVVEPLLPLVEVDRIREEIGLARALAEEEADADEDTDLDAAARYEYEAGEAAETDDETAAEREEAGHRHAGPPSPEEIRAGFARIAARLTGAH